MDLDYSEGVVNLDMSISPKDIEGIIFSEDRENVLIALKSGGHIYLPFKGSKVLNSLISNIEGSGSIDIALDGDFDILSNIEYKKLVKTISKLKTPIEYDVPIAWSVTVDPTTILKVYSRDYGVDILISRGVLYKVETSKTIEEVRYEIARNIELYDNELYSLGDRVVCYE